MGQTVDTQSLLLAATGDAATRELKLQLPELAIAATERTVQKLLDKAVETVATTNSQAKPVPSVVTGPSSTTDEVEAADKSWRSILSAVFPLIRVGETISNAITGNDSSKSPAELAQFVLPAPVRAQKALLGDGTLADYDYDQSGNPRPIVSNVSQATSLETSQNTAMNVHVNVQAMDSRSFLDHSSEIAQAVREALLQSHSLSDYLAEM